MLVFPIVNRERIVHVQVTLKSATKIGHNISDYNITPSDIIIHNHKYSESHYSNTTASAKSVMEFIRNSAKTGKSNILISTKQNLESSSYDIYDVKYPGDKITDGLDNLLGTLLLDLKNEGQNNKSRYLDLKKIGALENITPEKLEKLDYAASNMQYMNVSKYIKENDLGDLFKTLQLFDMIDFTIIKGSIIKLSEFKNILESFKLTNSKEYYSLLNYYELACSNQEEYSKLSYLNKIVNNRPLNLIHSGKEKVKVYTDEAA